MNETDCRQNKTKKIRPTNNIKIKLNSPPPLSFPAPNSLRDDDVAKVTEKKGKKEEKGKTFYNFIKNDLSSCRRKKEGKS